MSLCNRPAFQAALLPAVVVLAFGLTRADESRPPREVAFLVGVSKYDHIENNLDFAEEDALDLAAVLKDAGFEVVTLTGSARGKDRATRDNIETRLKALLDGDGDEQKTIRNGDLVLAALSGHGQDLFVKDPEAPEKKREQMFFAPGGKTVRHRRGSGLRSRSSS